MSSNRNVQIIVYTKHEMDEVCRMISEEGIINNNEELASNLNEFIRNQPPGAFQQENQNIRNNRTRPVIGRLEREVRERLIEIQRYLCNRKNVEHANEIMVRLGYQSYAVNTFRWRQFVENFKRGMINRNRGIQSNNSKRRLLNE